MVATGAIALLVAGCSSAGPDRVARPTQPTRPIAATQVTTGVVTPLATTPLTRRQIARITIDNADGLVAALGFIWVKTDDGRLVKVDPRTNRIVGQRKLDTATDASQYCQGIGTDGKSVWACATTDTATDVVKVDPTSLAPVKRVRVNKVFDQLRLPFAGGKLWVLGTDGSSLIGVDPATAAVTSWKLPVKCLQLSGSDRMLVATCRIDNLLLRIDPTSGAVSARRSIASPGFAVTSGTDTWVDTSEGVQRLDATLHTTAIYPRLVVGLDGDLAVDDTGAIWARQQSGFLLRIDPNRNAIIERVAASASLSGGSLLITADSIWTTASDDAVLLRLNR
jgi:streptogramin lyase